MKRHWEAQHEVIFNVFIQMKEWVKPTITPPPPPIVLFFIPMASRIIIFNNIQQVIKANMETKAFRN